MNFLGPLKAMGGEVIQAFGRVVGLCILGGIFWIGFSAFSDAGLPGKPPASKPEPDGPSEMVCEAWSAEGAGPVSPDDADIAKSMSEDYYEAATWVSGYIVGYRRANSPVAAATAVTVDQTLDRLESYCERNPRETLATAAQDLAQVQAEVAH